MKLSDYLKNVYEGIDFGLSSNLGYVNTPNCIRRCIRVKQEEKLLLFEIYSFYNDNKGYAFPTQQTLGLYLGISPSTVSKHLQKLEEKGLITSRGGKGKQKRYIPSFNLHKNPYIVLSEWFYFAKKVIQNKLPESIGGDMANQLLQYVNVKQSEEFTDKDLYGQFLTKLKGIESGFGVVQEEDIIRGFLDSLKKYVEQITGEQLMIDWEEEINAYKEKRSESKKTTGNKGNNSRRGYLPPLYSDDDDYSFG